MEGKTIIVSAGIIKHEGRVLIAKRKNDSTLEAGKWEFPGGKVEAFEDPKDTLVREISEELELKIMVNSLFDVVSYNYSSKNLHIIMIVYNADLISGKLKNNVHSESKWVTIKELDKFEFAGADMPIVEKLLFLEKSPKTRF